MSRNCIVCRKSIRKKTTFIRFRRPVAYRAPGPLGYSMGQGYGHDAGTEEKPEGHREDDGPWGVCIYTSNPPKTKAEAQRYANMQIVSVKRDLDPKTISEVTLWDGSSYQDDFFCSGTCAQKQGYAAARAGHRWTWK